MRGRMYASSFTGVPIQSTFDFWQIEAATNVAVVIHSIFLANRGVTDNLNDQMIIAIARSTGTVAGGTAPVPLDPSTNAADCTYVIADAVQLTLDKRLYRTGFSVLDGFTYRPPPSQRIMIEGGGKCSITSVVTLNSPPGNWDGTLIVEEIG